jgi:hypothetical protein
MAGASGVVLMHKERHPPNMLSVTSISRLVRLLFISWLMICCLTAASSTSSSLSLSLPTRRRRAAVPGPASSAQRLPPATGSKGSRCWWGHCYTSKGGQGKLETSLYIGR